MGTWAVQMLLSLCCARLPHYECLSLTVYSSASLSDGFNMCSPTSLCALHPTVCSLPSYPHCMLSSLAMSTSALL